jgi:ABC-type transport system involved in multi-copper enzyme maturation permease subunit
MQTIWALSAVVIKELYRRKDFYVLFVLTALITLVMGSVNFFNDDRIVRYLKEVCLLLIWISALVIAVTTTARQIPAERESRTIFPLLAKPVSRAQVVLGKFLGCWLACGLALVVFYVFFASVAAAREHELPVLGYTQALLLHWFMLAMVVALALLGSVVFAAPSSNTTICLVVAVGILLLGRHLNKVALGLDEPVSSILSAVYFAIPHLELFDVRDLIVHDWPPIPWGVIGLAVIYAAAYTALFLLATWLVFRKKSLN